MTASTTHEYKLTIREFHLDTFGHVNNAVYLQIFEEARWELVTQNGFGLKDIHKFGLGPIVLEVNIVFKRELTLRENVTVRTKLLSYDKKIGELEQSIVGEDEAVRATARFKIALFDLTARKIIAPTPEWLRAIGVQENTP